MMVKLIDEWRSVATKAWSVRWLMLANFLGAMPQLIDSLDGYVEPKIMVRVMLFVNVAALVSRFMKQGNMPAKPDA